METVEPELDALEKELAGETPEEPHPFLTLVLARMKTNPEEFNPDNSQWRVILDQSIRYLTAGEKAALRDAEREIALDHLHKKVMKKLLADKAPAVRPTITTSTQMTLGAYQQSPLTTTAVSAPSYDELFNRVLERLNALER
jgi:hypothetical protein